MNSERILFCSDEERVQVNRVSEIENEKESK